MPSVLKVAVPVRVWRLFDYLPPPHQSTLRSTPGVRVEVPFGAALKVGLVVAISETSERETSSLKCAKRLLDEAPLLAPVDLQLLSWASRYYHHPIGEVFAAAFTPLLRKARSKAPLAPRRLVAIHPLPFDGTEKLRNAPRQHELLRLLSGAAEGLPSEALSTLGANFREAANALVRKGLVAWQATPDGIDAVSATIGSRATDPPPLNANQHSAVDAVTEALDRYQAFLLEGVTGSGKTEVYLQLADSAIKRGRQVMVLLPEIALTPQLEARFKARISATVTVLHSGLSDGERRRAWLAVQRGNATVLLGTRSAVFTPMPSPGLIILDEEHDPSFKQQDGFRFSARSVAVMRAKLSGIPVVMGSATPSLETLYNVHHRNYRLLRLPDRAGGASSPAFRLVDIRGRWLTEGISDPLAAALKDTLQRGEQALLFMNRRGYAPTLICHACGWVAECRRCEANLVIHSRQRRLRCHHCGHDEALPATCAACAERDLRPLGLGTERVEAALAELMPRARVCRVDRDSISRKGQLEELLTAIESGRIDVLVGTQMLAKGHHFPRVTLVGILDVDAGLFSTDFRSGERTAQLIVQVAGRAGRAERPGTVLLQTRHPDHPLLRQLLQNGYPGFASACLEERKTAGLPPYTHQALWRAEAPCKEAPQRFLESLEQLSRTWRIPALQILGPAPAPLARRAGRYRWQLLFQSHSRGILHAAIDRALAATATLPGSRTVRWSVDTDPADLY